jgi:hypothetical protein
MGRAMNPVAAVADENLATHFTWVQRRTAGMRAVLGEDLVLTECGMPCDTFNAACRARLSGARAPERIREALAWFEGQPFSWWVGPADAPAGLGGLLEAEGLAPAETEVAMTASLANLRVEDGGAGPAPPLRIRRARTAGELADFARVNAANRSPPDALVIRFYERGIRSSASEASCRASTIVFGSFKSSCRARAGRGRTTCRGS